eukprot:CAMPEP_0194488466 /NCGR_PEP_ID=MMETSP0253-20130528/8383_1 /TAXON_ID=2966 /ORGANISM="Noctiluca scintillans" /LENGTH=69 /DNA_ID=CAMNT_0039328835 /DNA_START=63 /DNA_END=268 /DNA_ORIENTATION=+
MLLLRRTVRRALLAGAQMRNATTAIVTSSSETFSQKTWRWLDVTGFLTKWHSRRAWILDQDPPNRAATV